MAMLLGDFHHHIDADPHDGHFVQHSVGQLIDHAAGLGIQVMAVTCHETLACDDDTTRYAAERGIILLRGMEASVDGHHVLLLNFPEFPPGICSIADVARYKTADSLVIAPHPFYPSGVAGADTLREHRSVFDAIELSGLYTAMTTRFNRRAMEFAQQHGLPVVGNSDTHFLWQMGRTFTQIDAPAERSAVIDAIRRGRVTVQTRPLSWRDIMRFSIQSRSTTQLTIDALKYMARVARRGLRAQKHQVAPTAS